MGKNEWRGTAVDVQRRSSGTSQNPEQILNFILELTDNAGNVTQRLPVEMRGTYIQGVVRDGDTVLVHETRTDGGLVFADRLHNLTTNSVVRTRWISPRWGLRRIALIAGIGALVLAAVGAMAVTFFVFGDELFGFGDDGLDQSLGDDGLDQSREELCESLADTFGQEEVDRCKGSLGSGSGSEGESDPDRFREEREQRLRQSGEQFCESLADTGFSQDSVEQCKASLENLPQ